MTILQHDNLMHCLGAGKTIDGSSFIALPEYGKPLCAILLPSSNFLVASLALAI